MQELKLSADQLVRSLLTLSESEPLFLLDSSNVSYLDSHLLIAGIKPLETHTLNSDDPSETLGIFDAKLSDKTTASIFTISYDFALKLENMAPREKELAPVIEPDIFLATFGSLIIHDYKTGKTFLSGDETQSGAVFEILSACKSRARSFSSSIAKTSITSNFTRNEYVSAIDRIRELIRAGETYQTNLTQQFRADLGKDLTPQSIFSDLRAKHPSAFSAFIKRDEDWVLSISPERFAKTSNGKITTSPIKGTRKRGSTPAEDEKLIADLLTSEKDRAENIMIVDLLRNDIGRVCEYGSVKVEKLCELETHPSLFHLVSTVSGTLKPLTKPSEIIRAIFPCGSITGCPKVRTMEIIDEIENSNRGLSMGAIGYCNFEGEIEMSVAIRTMVINENKAVFNAGGGIVIDSDPAGEYQESLLKAKALLNALNCEPF